MCISTFCIQKIIHTEDNKEGFKRYLKYKTNKENFMVLTVSLVGQMVSGPEFVKFPPNANNKKKIIKKVSFQNDRLNRLCVFQLVHT